MVNLATSAVTALRAAVLALLVVVTRVVVVVARSATRYVVFYHLVDSWSLML